MSIEQMTQIACVGAAFTVGIATIVAAIGLAVGDRKEDNNNSNKEENK